METVIYFDKFWRSGMWAPTVVLISSMINGWWKQSSGPWSLDLFLRMGTSWKWVTWCKEEVGTLTYILFTFPRRSSFASKLSPLPGQQITRIPSVGDYHPLGNLKGNLLIAYQKEGGSQIIGSQANGFGKLTLPKIWCYVWKYFLHSLPVKDLLVKELLLRIAPVMFVIEESRQSFMCFMIVVLQKISRWD